MNLSELFTIWSVVYLLPIASTWVIASLIPIRTTKREWVKLNTLILHGALIVSVFLSQYFIYSNGLEFPWGIDTYTAIILLASLVIAVSLIGSFGAIYAVSAFIQEATMLSVAYLLFPSFSLWLVLLLIVPIFWACHLLSLEKWKLRLFLVTMWGIASVIIFYLTLNIYIIVALHTILGAFLARSIMFEWLKPNQVN